MRLLARREYNRREMGRKLAGREFDDEIITSVIEKLIADGYLSEMRYAEAYLRSRLEKGEAPWMAAKRAEQKGAESAAVVSVLAELTESYDAKQTARELVAMRDPAGLRFEDERVWQRQARFLRNKGFATDVILQVLKQQ